MSELTSPAPAASLTRAKYKGYTEGYARDSKTRQKFLDLNDLKELFIKTFSFYQKLNLLTVIYMHFIFLGPNIVGEHIFFGKIFF